MLLCQAKGAAEVQVRPFELPIHDPDQPAAEPGLHVPGLSWFPPFHDAEKLALATDAGWLSLWGIREKGNRDDPLLFRLLRGDYAIGSGPGRAQVVHADAEGYWVLSGGRLHRLNPVIRPHSGPDVVAAWPQPPALGSPLHAGQHHRDAAGRATLIMTTLALDQPTCLCTAVDAASGHFVWQRQLGFVPLHGPVAAAGRVVLRDANGLTLLDPAAFAGADGQPWQAVDEFTVREPLGADAHVLLLPGANECVQLTWSNQPTATKLRVRHVPPGGTGTTEDFVVPAPPAGTPAAGEGFVLLPLANGVAVRVDFAGKVMAGPNWRRRASTSSRRATSYRLAATSLF